MDKKKTDSVKLVKPPKNTKHHGKEPEKSKEIIIGKIGGFSNGG